MLCFFPLQTDNTPLLQQNRNTHIASSNMITKLHLTYSLVWFAIITNDNHL